jgi:hypothetical protein
LQGPIAEAALRIAFGAVAEDHRDGVLATFTLGLADFFESLTDKGVQLLSKAGDSCLGGFCHERPIRVTLDGFGHCVEVPDRQLPLTGKGRNAMKQSVFRDAWIEQLTKKNCGSCCVASIVNYAHRIRSGKNENIYTDNTLYAGLLVGGVHNLGSVTSRLAQWARHTHGTFFNNVTEVKVQGKKQHWWGIMNSKLLTGGATHRLAVTPNDAYFKEHDHRFLLRECSAYTFLGHFIVQTGEDQFWDPNRDQGLLPMDLADLKSYYNWIDAVGDAAAISMRADACQFDVEEVVVGDDHLLVGAAAEREMI